jgi:hypothetical protein
VWKLKAKVTAYKGLTAQRELRKNAPGVDERAVYHANTVHDGYEIVTFDVLIDVAALTYLGVRAAGNKNGTAKVGPLTVKITGRRRKEA